jgi:spoIIIJ-associated protein
VSADVSVEATGETVGEAKWQAVRELERLVPGLDRERVRFEVVSEGERGLLGVGYSPARVIAATEAPAQPSAAPESTDESVEATLVRGLLERAAHGFGVACTVRVAEGEDEVVATVTGSDLGIVIGRHGQTIDALQYLANALARRQLGDARRRAITIDAAGYRSRRRATLESLARSSAERAAATGRRVELDPMTAVERKIVHELLKDDPEVETASEGAEPNRYVVVFPGHPAD